MSEFKCGDRVYIKKGENFGRVGRVAEVSFDRARSKDLETRLPAYRIEFDGAKIGIWYLENELDPAGNLLDPVASTERFMEYLKGREHETMAKEATELDHEEDADEDTELTWSEIDSLLHMRPEELREKFGTDNIRKVLMDVHNDTSLIRTVPGDEVKYDALKGKMKGVILGSATVAPNHLAVLGADGRVYILAKHEFRKTGKHYLDVETMITRLNV